MAEEKKTKKLKINRKFVKKVAGFGVFTISGFALGSLYTKHRVGSGYTRTYDADVVSLGLLKAIDEGIIRFFDGDREISIDEASVLLQKKLDIQI